jgi:glycosyltransferase involved in cell wall biosynthesis
LGGSETALLDIFASVRAAAPTWPLGLICAADGPLVARAGALGVVTHVVPFPPAVARLGETGAADAGAARFAARVGFAAGPIAGYASALRAALDAQAPDIVHTNGLKMHLLGAYATDAPVVWHVHDYLGTRRVTQRLLRWTVGRCAAVIANSDSVAADVRAALGPGVEVTRVYNGLDLARFSPEGDRLDLDALANAAPPPPGTVRVGLLATFARWKGHDTFLRAIAALPRDLPLRAYVIGGPVYQTDRSQHTIDELRATAAALAISDRVVFTGVVDRPDAALRALDVAVHASTAPEPFGLAIAEAMACGRAVVASASGGAAELFSPGVDAVAHAPGDVAGLADAIRSLAGDATRRLTLGRAARTTATARFDRARLATELMPIYARLKSQGSRLSVET